jgi:hypothetical protein
MFDVILFIASLAGVGMMTYFIGRKDGLEQDRFKVLAAQAELYTVNAVRHNLNCLVGDLKYEVSELKPDAQAYNQSKGLWCTDQPELIRHHAKKERFFRLGYPEHKL